MSRSLAWCLAVLALAGCRHKLTMGSADRGALSDDSSPGDAGTADSATSPDELADASADASQGQDAGLPAFPYRWRRNGPAKALGLGEASFALTCVDSRTGDEVTGCSFLCRHEGKRQASYSCEPPSLGEPCADVFNGVGDEGPNRACVTVLQPPTDTTVYAQTEATDCWEWDAKPFPYTVVRPTFDASSTRVDVGLLCVWADPSMGLAPAPGCIFECSLDKEPYSYCFKRYARDNVGPGPHELRVRVSAVLPKPSPTANFYEGDPVSFVFRIDEGASPAVELPVLPPARPESDLGLLSTLVEPYTSYAQNCGVASREKARAAFVQYASAALARGVEPDSELVDACRGELEAFDQPVTDLQACDDAMLLRDDQSVVDTLLPTRLPFGCLRLDPIPPLSSGPCFTHAECQYGGCEQLGISSPLGVCSSSDPGEGTLCGENGCRYDEYCNSTCKKRRPEGSECLADFECFLGAFCSSSGRCVRQRCAGATCTIDKQCAGGSCLEQHCQ